MSELDHDTGNPAEQIAIIGMTGRFPGAKTLAEFWENLRDGVESITFFTPEELASADLDPALRDNPRYVGADGVIEDMDLFDADFFNIPPREAELMDPQHRLFLECAWELMEQAGYDSESYSGRVGVYGSANLSTYLVRNVMANPTVRETASFFQTMITNDKDFVATRVSYKLNLRGPSLSVATLCSSGSLAIHLGCQALINYQCDMALAGAISLQVSRNEAFFYQEGGIGDPDGHCRAFDARAGGTVSGSGIGLVALKRLGEAIADGDFIHAVIRSTAVNNDGAVKYSYTAPSVEGQAEVIAEAIALAEVSPETITYVETHGTGTRLGDPIEVTALTQAFYGSGAQGRQYCAIGSVKTNIGHLVNAGGVASLIKTVLAMQHKQIPPSLNFEEPNPEIDFANSPFFVGTTLLDWQPQTFPRRAGVSSFGIGGTNVHMIVEEAPALPPSGPARPWQLLLLSARSSTALEVQASQLADFLRSQPEVSLADVAFTLQVGRRAFPHRRALLCQSVEEALRMLAEQDPATLQIQSSKKRSVTFVFPGHGPLNLRRLRELYEHEPVFREHVAACAEVVAGMSSVDLRGLLSSSADEDSQQKPELALAALFAWEYALAHLWMAWGIRPEAAVADGMGELVAACVAGVLPLQSALALALERRRVSRAELSPAQWQLLSSSGAAWLSEQEQLDPEYWNQRRRQARPLAERITPALDQHAQILLEVGPEPTLAPLLERHPARHAQQLVRSSLAGQADQQAALHRLLWLLGQLWLAGAGVDWYGFQANQQRRRLPLPTYPFERKRYWIEPLKASATPERTAFDQRSSSKRADSASWFYLPSWRRTLPPEQTKQAEPAPPEQTRQAKPAPWLLFADSCGLGDRLAQRLGQLGEHVIKVVAGSAFASLSEQLFTLSPTRHDDYAALLEELASRQLSPGGIIYAWGVTPAGLPEAEQLQAYSSLLRLVQTLQERPVASPLRLVVLANGLADCSDGDELKPAQAALLGIVKVLQLEQSSIAARAIDVRWPAATRQADQLLGQLAAELAADNAEPVVAYRGKHRWAQAYEPVGLTAPGLAAQRGVYLLIGGQSSIADALASYCERAYQARIVQIGELAPTGTAIARPMVEAQIASQQQLVTAIARAEALYGPVSGVIYSPLSDDILAPCLIQQADAGALEAQLLRCSAELVAVDAALAGKQLEFCLVNSSLAAVLGGPGMVGVASAATLLDAFVQQRCSQSVVPWRSINWDAWKRASPATSSGLGERLEALALSEAEGGAVFDRLLAYRQLPQVVVSTVELAARIAQSRAAQQAARPEQARNAAPLHSRPELATPYVAPRSEIEQRLAEIWQVLLGIEAVGIHDNFFELGGHSLLGTQILSRVQQAFQVTLPLQALFDMASVAEMAALVERAQGERSQLDELEELLKEIESLSEEEIETVLLRDAADS